MRRPTLRNESDCHNIRQRIHTLSPESLPQWGKMDAGQMLVHCDKIMKIGLGKIILPKPNVLVRCVGWMTKKEMKIFNNGIPHNMPTFKEVTVNHQCNFDKAKAELLDTLEEFTERLEKNLLISDHALFGRMTQDDWGFMQYKHLHHHLKQFNV